MSLLLRVSTSLSVPLVHVVLYLGHDVLGALHRHREPPQVWYLHLLLHLLGMEVLLLMVLLVMLGVSSQGVVVVEPLQAGAGGELLLLLLSRLLQ